MTLPSNLVHFYWARLLMLFGKIYRDVINMRLLKTIIVIFFWSSCAVLDVVPVSATDYPLPIKSINVSGIYVGVGHNSIIDIPKTISSKFKAAVNEIEQSFSLYSTSSDQVSISLRIVENINDFPSNIRDSLAINKSGFWIQTNKQGIQINALNEEGALSALSTLELFVNRNHGQMPVGEIVDWPSLSFRGVLITPGPGVSATDINAAISIARKARMNALFLLFNKHFAFKTLAGATSSDAISLPELRQITSYAKENGLEVIPMINLLTRQSHGGIMQQAPKMGIAHSMYNVDTYDPADPENYRFVFSFLDEIIELIHPQKIHIGHSEVLGCYPKDRKNMGKNGYKVLPAKLFQKDVETLHNYLKEKNIETWMWGDMLLSKEEFPIMRPIGLNGNLPGYGKPLRQNLPKDIVICDWHYKDKQPEFPSAKAFADEGFRVVGATWQTTPTINNFTRYMTRNVGPNGIGMLAGIWGYWKEKKEISNRLIEFSGNEYWSSE